MASLLTMLGFVSLSVCTVTSPPSYPILWKSSKAIAGLLCCNLGFTVVPRRQKPEEICCLNADVSQAGFCSYWLCFQGNSAGFRANTSLACAGAIHTYWSLVLQRSASGWQRVCCAEENAKPFSLYSGVKLSLWSRAITYAESLQTFLCVASQYLN